MKENLNISAKDILFKIIDYGTEDYIHIAGFLKHDICATATLVPEEKKLTMKGVAIKSKCQNKEIGSHLLEYCEFYAQQYGFEEIFYHA